jgi:hypothetical protein
MWRCGVLWQPAWHPMVVAVASRGHLLNRDHESRAGHAAARVEETQEGIGACLASTKGHSPYCLRLPPPGHALVLSICSHMIFTQQATLTIRFSRTCGKGTQTGRPGCVHLPLKPLLQLLSSRLRLIRQAWHFTNHCSHGRLHDP